MRWRGREQSGNLRDRRGMSGGKIAAGGGVIGLIVVLFNMFMGGGDGGQLLNEIGLDTQSEQNVPLSKEDEEIGEMVGVILKDTEVVWTKIFEQNGMTYRAPELVLFTNGVQTRCGNATSASGPFYCPADQTVYMDMVFFDQLQQRFGAQGGDFAIAYVIAHEIGHHVQTLVGTSSQVRQAQERAGQSDANALSVALELQADFYAGVWTHHNEKINQMLEPGDIEEALSAANAVGDDAIQRKMQGHVNQDSFTHGSSEQRMYWFKKGLESGDVKDGDTFSALNLR